MPTTIYPPNYLLQVNNPAKSMNFVLKIEGLSYLFCMQNVRSVIEYGSGHTYGDGSTYGQTVDNSNSKPYIMYDTGISITQTLEPEQGRASITTFAVKLVDIGGLVTNIVSPGGTILDEILGREVTVYAGFANTVYPNDYYVATRGMITDVVTQAGLITLSLSDKGQKRRVAVFQDQTCLTTSSIGAGDVTIPVDDASQFYQRILGPDATYDSTVTLYCQIDDEVIQYSTITSGTTINVTTRGARGTTAATHDLGATVSQSIQIQDHAITIALKIMLSGWYGPYMSNVVCLALGTDGTNAIPTAILMPVGIDANLVYGLTIGDYITITGSISGNNGSYVIQAMNSLNGTTNNLLKVNAAFAVENPASTVAMALRSKYDTLPTLCGLGLSPVDVDVLGQEALRDDFLNTGIYTLQIYVQSQQTGKDFIEKELYLAIGCYSLTRYGQLSVNQTRPPIALQALQFLNLSNIIDPDKILVRRGINTRKFWNNIQYQYDQADDGTFLSVLRTFDTTSLNQIGINQVLPIKSNGIKTSLGGATLVENVANSMLSRYKNSAYEITLKCIFQVGTQIEVGDIVALQDDGYLQITNFDTGLRNLNTQLYEVTYKNLNFLTGQVDLKLTAGVQGEPADRYGVISPSSIIVSTSGQFISISSSYNPGNTADEAYKWQSYIGLPILVHDNTWTNTTQVTLVDVDDSSSPVRLQFSGTLGYSPAAGDIVDIPQYPTSTLTSTNALYKIVHGFADPTIAIVSAPNDTSFVVSSGNIARFLVNALLYVRDATFTNISPDVTVTNVNTGTNTVTVSGSMGFTPSSTYSAELIGFADGGAGYRIF